MSEKIRQLVKDAKSDTSGKWISLENAELLVAEVVRECSRIAEEVDGDSRARKCVLDHFGVK